MDIVSLISVAANLVAIVTFMFSIAKHIAQRHLCRRQMPKASHYDTCISQTTRTPPTRSMNITIQVTINFFY